MITSLIATILGMVGGLAPDLLKWLREKSDRKDERELLKLQAELQMQVAKANADAKLREIDAGIYGQEMAATREYLGKLWESQGKPTGIAWIDAFNAALRPTCISMIMILYMIVAVPFTLAVVYQAAAGMISWTDVVTLIFGSMVGESFMAIFGYLFGYRSTMNRPGAKS